MTSVRPTGPMVRVLRKLSRGDRVISVDSPPKQHRIAAAASLGSYSFGRQLIGRLNARGLIEADPSVDAPDGVTVWRITPLGLIVLSEWGGYG